MKLFNRILNAAIILATILLAGSLVVLYNPDLVRSRNKNNGIVGTNISVVGLDFSKSRKTLLLFLQDDCGACRKSIPFYQKLGKTFIEPSNVRLVVITPGSPERAKQYLMENAIRVDDIKQGAYNMLGVQVSPTLILADNLGVVTGTWTGQLTGDGESGVLTKLTE